MTVLSKKARRFIESGAQLLPDRDMRAAWLEWSVSHPMPKGSFLTQEKQALPREVLNAAIAALDMKIKDLTHRRSEVSDEEVYQFDNDISYLHAVEGDLKKLTAQ